MLSMTSGRHGSWTQPVGEWAEHWGVGERRHEHSDQSAMKSLVVAGVVAVGVGALLWAYMGPDLVRYMKIHRM